MARENKYLSSIIKIIDESKIVDSFKEIVDHIQYLEDRNESLRKELAEYNKDTKIQELNNEVNKTRKSILADWNDVEKQRSREFQEKHRDKCGRSNVSYIITGTGIGTCIIIRCNICGEELDITDMNRW